jgi:hypothetical protein
MTEDSIRVTAGRPTAGAAGHTAGAAGAAHRRRGLPIPSELLVLLATVIAVLIAAAVDDALDAPTAWILVTVLAATFIFSRGMVKRGLGDDGL